MNKPKAPKDMTATEFVAEIRRRFEKGCFPNPLDYNDLWGMLSEPAPNPFTPDQLATMRELQRSGYKYAAADSDLDVFAYRYKPRKARTGNEWLIEEDEADFTSLPFSFLQSVLSPNDPEPLCFADYASLDSPCEGGER